MNKTILVVVAHSDDEALGCGGTIYNYTQKGDHVHLLVLTDGDSSRQNHDISYRAECLSKSCKTLGIKSHRQLDFKDNQLDTYPQIEIINHVEKMVQEVTPEAIYTHSCADLNIDHKITHRAVMTACRPTANKCVKSIMSFEVPSSTGWDSPDENAKFTPNVFIEINKKSLEKKIEALYHYDREIQNFPHPRSEEYIEALSKVRGANVGVHYAEAFKIERLLILDL